MNHQPQSPNVTSCVFVLGLPPGTHFDLKSILQTGPFPLQIEHHEPQDFTKTLDVEIIPASVFYFKFGLRVQEGKVVIHEVDDVSREYTAPILLVPPVDDRSHLSRFHQRKGKAARISNAKLVWKEIINHIPDALAHGNKPMARVGYYAGWTMFSKSIQEGVDIFLEAYLSS